MNGAPTENVVERFAIRSASNATCGSDERKTFLAEGSVSTASDGLARADFIAPEVVQFLGVRSLVRFGAACKYHALVVSKEVERRKKCIADIEDEVVRLMSATTPLGVPTRTSYSRAAAASAYAMSLIDDEVNILQKKMGIKSYYDIWCDWDPDYRWRNSDVFLEERKRFVDYDTFYREHTVGPLHVLPRCFYFPPRRELSSPSPDSIQKASTLAWQVWANNEGWEDLYSDPDSDSDSDPDPESYYECVKCTAHALACDAHNGMIDAFRIAARSLFYSEPTSRACLWSTLILADKYESETLRMASSMHRWIHRAS
ncbi:hypothetical protein ACHAW5_006600 [Stephanodiscus triporus]|uniref:Uncharacterized protein n=1 Tax=Stephanodiscus triporus TaxID=2934178 RepID=A0ABD3PKB1_9STRA